MKLNEVAVLARDWSVPRFLTEVAEVFGFPLRIVVDNRSSKIPPSPRCCICFRAVEE